jgi:hypothetical protein
MKPLSSFAFNFNLRRYVTAAQALSGIAKDLTKLGGKTVTKLVTPEEKQESLFKLVSGLTG